MEEGTEEICKALAMHRAAGEAMGLLAIEIEADDRVHTLVKAAQLLFSLMEGEVVNLSFVWSFVDHYEVTRDMEPGDPMSLEELTDPRVRVLVQALGLGEDLQ